MMHGKLNRLIVIFFLCFLVHESHAGKLFSKLRKPSLTNNQTGNSSRNQNTAPVIENIRFPFPSPMVGNAWKPRDITFQQAAQNRNAFNSYLDQAKRDGSAVYKQQFIRLGMEQLRRDYRDAQIYEKKRLQQRRLEHIKRMRRFGR